jgi:hypothetical protein
MANVPNVPGVPQLSSYIPNNIALLVADVVSIFNFLAGSGWGIYLNGVQAFDYDSILDFDYKQDYTIADYPIENGGFFAYDKVQHPFDIRMRISSTSSPFGNQQLLFQVQQAAADLNLYDVATPEQAFSDCNITHFDWRRSARAGVDMIVIDLWFQEIRQSATSTFSTTASPTVAGQEGTGLSTPLSLTPSQQGNLQNINAFNAPIPGYSR